MNRMTTPPTMPGIQKAARNPSIPPPNNWMITSITGTAINGPIPCDDWSSPMPVPRCFRNHRVTAAVRGTWKMPIAALRITPKNR